MFGRQSKPIYYGLAYGGPLDGQEILAESEIYRVPVTTEVQSFKLGDIVDSASVEYSYVEYKYVFPAQWIVEPASVQEAEDMADTA